MPEFTYSVCGPFAKEYKNKKKPGDSWYIYQNEVDKACFQYYMAYGDFKDLTRRTASDFFDEQTSGSSIKDKFFLMKY